MNVWALDLSNRATREPLPATTLSASWQQTGMHRWIDVETSLHEALRQLLVPLDLRTVARDEGLQSDRPFVSNICWPSVIELVKSTTQHLYLEWNLP